MCRLRAESFAPIPSLGRPTPEDRLWRRRAAEIRPSRARRDLIFNEVTVERWWQLVESDDVRQGLRAARYVGHILAKHEERLVRLGRDLGLCWEDLAWYAGVSRQAMHARWAKRIRAQAEAPPEPVLPGALPGAPRGET